MTYLLASPVIGKLDNQNTGTEIQWRNGVLMTNTPNKIDGKDLWPDPYTLLLSSLVACTLTTLRMYLELKGITAATMQVEAKLVYRVEKEEMVAHIERKIDFADQLDNDLLVRLIRVAKNCPISKILLGSNKVTTAFVKRNFELHQK